MSKKRPADSGAGKGEAVKKILVICDDVWHPAEVIEKGFGMLEGEDYSFDYVKDAKDILTEKMLARYPVIAICKSNNVVSSNGEPWFEDTVTEVGPREFKCYMEQGGSILAIHSGTAYSRRFAKDGELFEVPNELYLELLGTEFTGHPLRCPVHFHITAPCHPIMRGAADFTERDEHYQMIMRCDDAEILMESSSDSGQTVPAGYIRRFGKGNLIVLTPGHTLAVWENENWQKILANALDWCTKEEMQV